MRDQKEREQDNPEAETPQGDGSPSESERVEAMVDIGPTEGEDEVGGLTVLEREMADLSDRHLRLAAEFENYRKRTREELLSSGTRAQASLVATLLDALDDFQRITELDETHASLESVLEGIQLVERKLQRSLSEAGVEWVEPWGEAFDPERMEAVMRVPTQEEEEDDTVDQVFQRGVEFKGHLVRPARVTVRKLDA